jgi:hypothetical protein
MAIQSFTCPECSTEFSAFKTEGVALLKKCPNCGVTIDLDSGKADKRKAVVPRGIEAVPEKRMPPRTVMIIGIILSLIGIIVYFLRGKFAAMFLGAEIMSGNDGMWDVDNLKINTMIIYSGVVLLVGMISTIFGMFQLKKFVDENGE